MRVAASAASAREGFEAIADARPQVALVDLHLPDDDGLSLCLRTRSLPEPPRVIIYSAFADAGLAVRAVIAGAEGVLAKATAPRDAARRAARRRRLHARRPRAARARRAPGPGRPADPRHARPRHADRARSRSRSGSSRSWLEARRWAMLARLGGARRIPLAAA